MFVLSAICRKIDNIKENKFPEAIYKQCKPGKPVSIN